MKCIVFVTAIMLTSQCAWGMESTFAKATADRPVLVEQANLESEEKSLQFVKSKDSHDPISVPIKLYKVQSGFQSAEMTPNTYFTEPSQAGSYEAQLVVEARDKLLVLTDLKTQKTFDLYDSEELRNRHTCAVFNSNGLLLAVGYKATFGARPTVALWDTTRKQVKANAFPSRKQDVTALAFNPCDTEFAVGCDDGTIKLLNYETGREFQVKAYHAEAVLALAYNRLQQFASLSEDSTIKIWGIGDDGLQCKQIIQLDQRQHIIGFYPDESTLFSCNRYKTDQISFHKVNS